MDRLTVRCLDIAASVLGLILLSPVLVPTMFLVWLQDRHSPFYIAPRVGKDGRLFRMVKLRSMQVNADSSGVDSTAAGDVRITRVGHFIRRYKLDEVTQLWNVLKGDMSLVGPRPNVQRETDLYTEREKLLLGVRPGVTDYASIVFADEGNILEGQEDPDLAYNQLIRPWKSRLGLFYIDHRSLALDIRLVWLTAVTVLSHTRALAAVSADLEARGASPDLVRLALRQEDLVAHPPPGAERIVTGRSLDLC
jgi:lipopolysaccharide/colanic/teichoic acid biosynthesis glycosyltransferase